MSPPPQPSASRHHDRPIIHFNVVSGPDLGKQCRFDQDRITIGRDVNNDFMLSDGFVSNWHGELVREETGFVYYDLRSRHGSLVLINDVSINLHDSQHVRNVRVVDGSEIQVGSTLIRLNIVAPSPSQRPRPDTFPSNPSEKYITAAHRPVDEWTRGLGGTSDTRVDIFFRLAGQLNSLTRIEDILELIIEATFEAFPAANFFALSLMNPDQQSLSPFITRNRMGARHVNSDDIISQSILQRVVETRESVLFVRDHIGAPVSESILEAEITACLCSPLVGQRSLLGVMQVDTRGSHGSLFGRQDLELFSVLASNAAFALERAQLTEDIYRMFEGFVRASVTAIESRDPTTAGHSERVAGYTILLAECINNIFTGPTSTLSFSADELTELRYAALLHDFGKVGVRESVLTKAARLNDTEMQLIGNRFANFKNIHWRMRTEALLDSLQRDSRGPMPSEMSAIKDSYERFSRDLDKDLRVLDELRKKRDLEPEELERIQAIGRRRVTGLFGQPMALLTDRELKDLSIARSNLNEEEWENMRSHAAKSQAFLEQIPWSAELKQIPCFAGAHHEKLNGTGYPQGLKGDEIAPQVRILTIADIFDALTASDRPYKRAMTHERACSLLIKEARQGLLDKDLVDVFVHRVVPSLPEEPS